MEAVMIKDSYIDVVMYYPYEIERVFKNKYIKLKGNPSKYESKSFRLLHEGKKIKHKEAYRLHKIEVVKQKLGLK